MHLGLRQLLITGVFAFCAVFSREVNAQEEKKSAAPPAQESSPSGYPYSQIVEDDWKVNNPLIPYRDRRATWGALVHFGYSNFDPIDYDPDFVGPTEDYDSFYAEMDSPMLELQISPKLNLGFLSVTADVGVGYGENAGKFGSKLTVTPVRLGGTLALDGIFGEPYIVPYGFAGMYAVYYKESLASQSVEGRTSPAMYYGGGIRVQLDWLDSRADDEALIGFGLENTFLDAEARSFADSGDLVPDLSSPEDTPFMFNAGLSLEF